MLSWLTASWWGLLLWTTCAQHATSAGLRFAASVSQEVVAEDEVHRLAPFQLLDDGAYGSIDSSSLISTEISCIHGTLQVDQDQWQLLNHTTLVCPVSATERPVARRIAVLSTATEAALVLASLVYTPDLNYHGQWDGVNTCGPSADTAETVRVGLSTAIKLQDEGLTCETPLASVEDPTWNVHERRISVMAVNDAPTIAVSVQRLTVAKGACVGIPSLQLGDPDNTHRARVTLSVGVETGKLRLDVLSAVAVSVQPKGFTFDQLGAVWTDSSVLELIGFLDDLEKTPNFLAYCSQTDQSVGDTITVKVSDSGFCGSGPSQPLTATTSISVVMEEPVVSAVVTPLVFSPVVSPLVAAPTTSISLGSTSSFRNSSIVATKFEIVTSLSALMVNVGRCTTFSGVGIRGLEDTTVVQVQVSCSSGFLWPFTNSRSGFLKAAAGDHRLVWTGPSRKANNWLAQGFIYQPSSSGGQPHALDTVTISVDSTIETIPVLIRGPIPPPILTRSRNSVVAVQGIPTGIRVLDIAGAEPFTSLPNTSARLYVSASIGKIDIFISPVLQESVIAQPVDKEKKSWQITGNLAALRMVLGGVIYSASTTDDVVVFKLTVNPFPASTMSLPIQVIRKSSRSLFEIELDGKPFDELTPLQPSTTGFMSLKGLTVSSRESVIKSTSCSYACFNLTITVKDGMLESAVGRQSMVVVRGRSLFDVNAALANLTYVSTADRIVAAFGTMILVLSYQPGGTQPIRDDVGVIVVANNGQRGPDFDVIWESTGANYTLLNTLGTNDTVLPRLSIARSSKTTSAISDQMLFQVQIVVQNGLIRSTNSPGATFQPQLTITATFDVVTQVLSSMLCRLTGSTDPMTSTITVTVALVGVDNTTPIAAPEIKIATADIRAAPRSPTRVSAAFSIASLEVSELNEVPLNQYIQTTSSVAPDTTVVVEVYALIGELENVEAKKSIMNWQGFQDMVNRLIYRARSVGSDTVFITVNTSMTALNIAVRAPRAAIQIEIPISNDSNGFLPPVSLLGTPDPASSQGKMEIAMLTTGQSWVIDRSSSVLRGLHIETNNSVLLLRGSAMVVTAALSRPGRSIRLVSKDDATEEQFSMCVKFADFAACQNSSMRFLDTVKLVTDNLNGVAKVQHTQGLPIQFPVIRVACLSTMCSATRLHYLQLRIAFGNIKLGEDCAVMVLESFPVVNGRAVSENVYAGSLDCLNLALANMTYNFYDSILESVEDEVLFAVDGRNTRSLVFSVHSVRDSASPCNIDVPENQEVVIPLRSASSIIPLHTVGNLLVKSSNAGRDVWRSCGRLHLSCQNCSILAPVDFVHTTTVSISSPGTFVTISGSESEMNNALRTLEYHPNQPFSGFPDQLSVSLVGTADDPGLFRSFTVALSQTTISWSEQEVRLISPANASVFLTPLRLLPGSAAIGQQVIELRLRCVVGFGHLWLPPKAAVGGVQECATTYVMLVSGSIEVVNEVLAGLSITATHSEVEEIHVEFSARDAALQTLGTWVNAVAVIIQRSSINVNLLRPDYTFETYQGIPKALADAVNSSMWDYVDEIVQLDLFVQMGKLLPPRVVTNVQLIVKDGERHIQIVGVASSVASTVNQVSYLLDSTPTVPDTLALKVVSGIQQSEMSMPLIMHAVNQAPRLRHKVLQASQELILLQFQLDDADDVGSDPSQPSWSWHGVSITSPTGKMTLIDASRNNVGLVTLESIDASVSRALDVVAVNGSLRYINSMLQRVLYSSNGSCETDDRLTVAISDTWFGRDAQSVSVEKTVLLPACSIIPGQPTMVFPASVPLYDPIQRSLALTTLAWTEAKHQSLAMPIDLHVAVGFSVTPDVQRIRVLPPRPVQVITISVTTTSGTFDLAIDVTISGVQSSPSVHVYADAVAAIVDEVLGESNDGHGPAESMEAQIRALYALVGKDLNISVKKLEGSVLGTAGNTWIVQVIGSVDILPSPRISSSNLPGSNTATVTSQMMAPIVQGSFTLQVGFERTRALAPSSTAIQVQDALEALTSLEVVKVTMPSKMSWEITFLSPSSNIPLITADNNLSQPARSVDNTTNLMDPSIVNITRLTAGVGQGQVIDIQLSATRTDPAYQITANATGVLIGTFRLGFQDPTDSTQPLMAVSGDIAFDAVASIKDEGVVMDMGGRRGASLEHQVRGMMKTNARWMALVSVMAVRSSVAGGFTWSITFQNAPSDFPVLVLANSSVSGVGASVSVQRTQSSNRLGGTFKVAFGSQSTSALPVTATENQVANELMKLNSVRSSSFSYGSVIVRRSSSTSRGDYVTFAVMFAEELVSAVSFDPTTGQPQFIVDGSALTGVGAFARVVGVQKRSQPLLWQSGPSVTDPVLGWTDGVRIMSNSSVRVSGSLIDVMEAAKSLRVVMPEDWSGQARLMCGLPQGVLESELWQPFHTLDTAFVSIAISPAADVQRTSRTAAVIVDHKDGNSSIVVAEGSVSQLGDFGVVADSGSRLQQYSLTISTRNKSLSSGAQPPVQFVSIYGTPDILTSALESVEYHAHNAMVEYDELKFSLVDVLNNTVSDVVFPVHVFCKPIAAIIRLNGSIEDPLSIDAWSKPVISVKPDQVTRITGIRMDNMGRVVDSALVAMDASCGQVFLTRNGRNEHQSNGHQVQVTGPLEIINQELRFLYYKSGPDCGNSDTIAVSSWSSDLANEHKRQILIIIEPPNIAPRVSMSTRVYHSYEDAMFRFPNLTLDPGSANLSYRGSTGYYNYDLWAYDLFEAPYRYPSDSQDSWGHMKVATFNGSVASSKPPRWFCTLGSSFLFAATTDAYGEELWASDGSASSTRLMVDLLPGVASSGPAYMTALGSRVLFSAEGLDLSWALTTSSCNGLRSSSIDSGVLYVVSSSNVWDPTVRFDCPSGFTWASTAEGLGLFRVSSSASEPFVFWNSCQWTGYIFGGKSRKYFRFSDSATTGAYKHAGRKDSAPVEYSFDQTEFAGILCLNSSRSSNAATTGRELWITDGTVQGTTLLLDISPGGGSSDPKHFTLFKSMWLVFQASTPSFGAELFKTDGTAGGTVLVEDIWTGPRSSRPSFFSEWSTGDGRMYFAATTDLGRELWATDGYSSFTGERTRRQRGTVPVGTTIVKDICSGSGSSSPQYVTATSLGVFFSATDCVNGRELWLSDGTPSGTKMVKDLNSATGQGSNPAFLTWFQSKLYFQAAGDGNTGKELYVSDGTTAGTVLLIDINPGARSSSPALLSAISATRGSIQTAALYFAAAGSNGYVSLWTSSGTSSGTSSILDDVFAMSKTFDLERSDGSRPLLFSSGTQMYFVTNSTAVSVQIVRGQTISMGISVSSGTIALSDFDGPAGKQYSATLNVSGTYDELVEALARLTFIPPLNWNDDVAVGKSSEPVVNWVFDVSFDNTVVRTEAVLVVAPKRDPPVINVPNFVQDAAHSMPDYLSFFRASCLPVQCIEDVICVLAGFSIRWTDDVGRPDAAQAVLRMGVLSGLLQLQRIECATSVTTSSGDDTSFRTLMMRAPMVCIDRVLQQLRYVGNPNFSGTDTLQISVTTDSGESDLVNIPVVVAEQNDAPYVITSEFYEAVEDVPLLLTDLVLLDPDATKSEQIRVEITATYGFVALARQWGISSINGSLNGDTHVVFTGTLYNVSKVMKFLTFTSIRDWNSIAAGDLYGNSSGFASVMFQFTDAQIFNSSTSSVVYFNVVPAPDPVLISLPRNSPDSVFRSTPVGSLEGFEDQWLDISGLSFDCADLSFDSVLTIALSVTQGILRVASTDEITIVNQVSEEAPLLSMSGTYSAINRATATLQYLPRANYHGTDALSITATASDEYTGQRSIDGSLVVPISVNPVNDKPQWVVPPGINVTVYQDLPAIIHGVTVIDNDVAMVNCSAVPCSFDLEIEVHHGSLSLPRLAERNAASHDSATFDSLFAMSGSLDDINYIIDEMVFTMKNPEYYASNDTDRRNMMLILTIDDLGLYGSGGTNGVSTTIWLNPVAWDTHVVYWISPVATVNMVEDVIFAFNGMLQIVDPDSNRDWTSIWSLSISCPIGELRLPTNGIQTAVKSSQLMVVEGLLDQLNQALQLSTFIPPHNWVGASHIGLTVQSIDGKKRTETTVHLFVTSECDVPQWNILTETYTTDEDTTTPLHGIQLTQDEITATSQLTLSVESSNGGVSLRLLDGLNVISSKVGKSIDNELASSENVTSMAQLFYAEITVEGEFQLISKALAAMMFKPDPDFNSWNKLPVEVRLHVQVGCDGGGSISSSAVVRVHVRRVSDPPRLVSNTFTPILNPLNELVSSSQPVLEIRGGATIHIDQGTVADQDDQDGISTTLLMNVTSTNGVVHLWKQSQLELEQQGQLMFLTSDAPGLVVVGDITSINQLVMGNLAFTADEDVVGVAFVTITLSDLGNHGMDTPLTSTYSMPIRVTAQSQVPKLYLPLYGIHRRSLRINEGTSVLLSGAPMLESTQLVSSATSIVSLARVRPQAPDSATRVVPLETFRSDSARPSYFVLHRGKTLFRGVDSAAGAELWVSDGTAEGTRLLFDLLPGTAGSNPSYLTRFSVDDRVYFAADGLDLRWKLNQDHQDECGGFRQSSRHSDIYFAVADMNIWDPQQVYDCPPGFRWISTAEARAVFTGTTQVGNEPLTYFDQCGWIGYLWGGVSRKAFRFSDSKTTGAFKDAGFQDSYRVDIGSSVHDFAGIVCKRLARNEVSQTGSELWVTDGTIGGTQRVVDINSGFGGSMPAFFVEANSLLYFQAFTPDTGSELWATDGTASGTFLVADVEFGTGSSSPMYMTPFATQIMFSAMTSTVGREPWFSDGDPRASLRTDKAKTGTNLLLDICAGRGSSNPKYFAAMDTKPLMLFQADDCIKGPELWRTDGTRAGTALVMDINLGSVGSSPAYLTLFAHLVYFQADDGVRGPELWVSDGTSSGTKLLIDLVPGAIGGRPSYLSLLSVGQTSGLGFVGSKSLGVREFWFVDGATPTQAAQLFPASEEAITVADTPMEDMYPPRLLSLDSSSFLFFSGGHNATGWADPQHRLRSSTRRRSMTVVNAIPDQVLQLTISCSNCVLAVLLGCSDAIVSGSMTGVVNVVGSTTAINCVVEQVTYHALPGAFGWDELVATVSTQRSLVESTSPDAWLQTIEQRLAIEVIALNSPPTVVMPTYIEVAELTWIPIDGIQISDQDAEDGVVFVRVSANFGSVRLSSSTSSSSVVQPSDATLELTTDITRASTMLRLLEYGCMDAVVCFDGLNDFVTVYVDDNGHNGDGGPQTAQQATRVQIRASSN